MKPIKIIIFLFPIITGSNTRFSTFSTSRTFTIQGQRPQHTLSSSRTFTSLFSNNMEITSLVISNLRNSPTGSFITSRFSTLSLSSSSLSSRSNTILFSPFQVNSFSKHNYSIHLPRSSYLNL